VSGEFQWAGFGQPERLRARVETGTVLGDDGGQLAVVDDDGGLLGDVSWQRLRTGPGTSSWCWTIGILLLPEARGAGHGTRAQRLLADYLFAHTTCERVQADTDIDNLAEQRALDRAGFVREGVMRAAQWRSGRWHDMVLYAVTRTPA
jgi:aminoglycoside 6'-N-acetyltransferase